MICPSCGKEVADDAPSCPYCGRIFNNHSSENNPLKQTITPKPVERTVPVNKVATMPARTSPQQVYAEKTEVHKAVRLRRKQRWFFYALIIVLFLASIGMLVKTYNDNTKLINQINGVNEDLAQKQKELSQSKVQLDAASSTLTTAQKELQAKTDKLKIASNSQISLANIILKTGLQMSKEDLKKIPYAKVTVPGVDTDKDGLADEVERALGTDKTLADTDNDGYSDYNELLQGYNPLGTGNLGLDSDFAAKYKGRLLLQKKDLTYAWYVAGDGQRYYLGNSGDDFALISKIAYWNKK